MSDARADYNTPESFQDMDNQASNEANRRLQEDVNRILGIKDLRLDNQESSKGGDRSEASLVEKSADQLAKLLSKDGNVNFKNLPELQKLTGDVFKSGGKDALDELLVKTNAKLQSAGLKLDSVTSISGGPRLELQDSNGKSQGSFDVPRPRHNEKTADDTDKADYKIDKADGKSDRGDGKSDRGDGKSDRGDGKSDKGDGRSDKNDGRSDKNDGKSDKGDGKSDKNDGRSDKIIPKWEDGGEKDKENNKIHENIKQRDVIELIRKLLEDFTKNQLKELANNKDMNNLEKAQSIAKLLDNLVQGLGPEETKRFLKALSEDKEFKKLGISFEDGSTPNKSMKAIGINFVVGPHKYHADLCPGMKSDVHPYVKGDDDKHVPVPLNGDGHEIPAPIRH